MDSFKLGERIKYFRKKAGYTQENLADLLDKSQHHITQIERGQSLPSVPMLYDLSQVLQVPMDCFFMDEDRLYAEFAAIRFEHMLDRFSDEQLITFSEIQQAIYSVIHKDEENPDLWKKTEADKKLEKKQEDEE